MDIYNKIVNLKNKYPKMVMALGMFDGVHRGHQAVIQRTVELAQKIQGTPAVFTFNNHPLTVLNADTAPLQIANTKLREKKLADFGIAVLINIDFTKEFAKITPDEFLKILQDNFAPIYLVTGSNYTFGASGSGTAATLTKKELAYGFKTEICPAVEILGNIVSSTRIRALIASDDLAKVNECLGYPFTVIDKVIHGDKRGRTIGFPTANIAIDNTRAMLPNGVYAVRIIYNQRNYNGIANIGDNPTFIGCNRRIEVNIENFSENIYDKELTVEFIAKLRAEKKFSGANELIAAINQDKIAAKKYYKF